MKPENSTNELSLSYLGAFYLISKMDMEFGHTVMVSDKYTLTKRPARVKDFSKVLGISIAHTHRIINKLEEVGMIRKSNVGKAYHIMPDFI